MTTGGEGGMVTCDDETLWNKLWSYKDHGKNFKTVLFPECQKPIKKPPAGA